MKRFCLIIALLATLLVPVAVAIGPASAVNIFNNCGSGSAGGTPDACTEATQGQGSSQNPVIKAIKIAIDVLSFLVGVASVVGIIVGGIRLILANGDSGSISSARSGITYSLVGVAIVILAQTFVTFVLDKIKL